MAKGKLDVGLEVEKFAVEMIKNFDKSVGKGGWKGNDRWWYLSQLAIAVRELEEEMVKKNSSLIQEKACNVANTAMILNDLCIIEKSKRKRAKKTVIRKK